MYYRVPATLGLMVCLAMPCVGCRKSDNGTADRKPTASKPQEVPSPKKDDGLGDFLATNPPQSTLPPGHPPLDAAPKQPPAPLAPESNLDYDIPKDWTPEKPKTRMRKEQYVLPGVDGANGQMVVFYFGPGQGGPTQMNIDRWIGMFSKPDRTPVGPEAASIETKKVGNLAITLVDVTGIYTDAMGGQATPTAMDYRLYAAVVEFQGGDKWFFKAVGPATTMAEHRASFDTFLTSLKEKK